MPSDNSLNPSKGKLFQIKTSEILSKYFDVEFQLDYPIAIGNPPKSHRYDLVSSDLRYIGECKNYSWTETGNVPSAKMGFINEALFYLSFLPPETMRFVVLRKDTHQQRKISLAEYYYRTYQRLLNGISIFEADITLGTLKEINAPEKKTGIQRTQ
ncbi:MAG TPA: hypothetical protein VIO58_10890 [Candidatus Methanoperedens sp.]